MKCLLLIVLTAVLLPDGLLSAVAAPPAKQDPLVPSAKPAAKPSAEPGTEPSTPPEKAAVKTEVLLFGKFRSPEELAAKLPKPLVNPRLIAHLTALHGAYKEALTGVAL